MINLRPVIFGFLTLIAIAAQIPATEAEGNPETSSHNNNVLVTTYTKGLEYDGWEEELRLYRKLAGGGSLNCYEYLNASLHRIPGFLSQWRLDQQLGFSFEQPINDRLDWMVVGDQEIFYDQRARRPQDNLYHEAMLQGSYHLGLGGNYEYNEKVSAKGSIGPLFEHRRKERSQGACFDMNILSFLPGGPFEADGWLNYLNTGSEFGWSAKMDGVYEISSEANDIYELTFERSSRREFSPYELIEGRRNDESLNIFNRLGSSRTEPLQMTWDSELARKRASHSGSVRERRDHEFTWENELHLVYSRSGLRTTTLAGLDLQEQQYENALIQGQRTYLGLHTVKFNALLDSVAFEARVIKYRFDTPDEDDRNDRDELRYLLTIRAGEKITSNLGVRLKLETDLHHLVYILRPRSAENRWSRLFSFSCELPWRDDPVTNIARFTVAGNYNVYDFPPSDTDLSHVYRHFSYEDTLRFTVHTRMELELGTSVLIDEHGRFRWDDWALDISENGYSMSASFTGAYKTEDLRFGLGWKTHHRYSWLHQSGGGKIEGDNIRSDGPVLSLKAAPADRLRVDLSGQVLRVRHRSRSPYNLPDIRCSLSWML